VANGAILTNLSGGVVSNGGTAAIYGVGGPGTVINSGSIAASSRYAVFLAAVAWSRMRLRRRFRQHGRCLHHQRRLGVDLGPQRRHISTAPERW